MNGTSRAILLGMVFGDGYIQPNSRGCNSATLVVRHSTKQKEYADYKAQLVTNVLGGKRPQLRFFDNNGFPGCEFAKTNSYLRVLRSWLYNDGKKKLSPYIDWLTPEGLAIWYMDDGGLGKKKRNGKIHAIDLFINCHTELTEAYLICEAIMRKFAVQFKPHLNNGKYRIRCGTIEARKFAQIVAPFIHGSMMYKLAIPENSTSARRLELQREPNR